MKEWMKRYIAACVLLPSLLLLSAGCGQEEEEDGTDRPALTLTIKTRATGDTEGPTGREHMKTVRLILVNSGRIIYNHCVDNIADEATQYVFREGENGLSLPLALVGERLDYYVVANEEGVSYTGNWDDITVDDLKKMNLDATVLSAMNAASSTTPIPQTAFGTTEKLKSKSEGNNEVSVQLNFVVAKVRLTINNTLPVEQKIEGISVSEVNQTSTPLFAPETLSDTNNNGTASFGDITIEAGAVETRSLYIYENTGGQYILSAQWSGKEQKLDINTAANIQFIRRGTLIDIKITLKQNITGFQFYVRVNSWDEKEMGIPSFN